MARLTGGVVAYPGFAPHRELFDATRSQACAQWPATARFGFRTTLLLKALTPFVLTAYHHVRITRQWRLDEAKPALRWIPGLARNWGFVAFDWLVDGRHAETKLGPTFANTAGDPDYFSARIQEYVRAKKRIVFDSTAILPSMPPGSGEMIRAYFQPRADGCAAAKTWLNAQRSAAGADVVVGVAVRQGDFRTWGGGVGFVEPARFAELLREVEAQMTGRTCLFALCSDEPIGAEQFPGLKTAVVPRGVMPQLCTLMQCDAIVGTAGSTFIQWASFLGNTPWLPVVPRAAVQVAPLAHWQIFGRTDPDRCPVVDATFAPRNQP